VSLISAYVSAGAVTVCATCEIRTIKEGVTATPAGGVLELKSGRYLEHDILLNKRIHVTAAPGEHPVIDASGIGNGFVVHAPGVEISNLTIRNPGLSFTSELAAIKVEETSDCKLSGNTVEGSHFGIYLAHSRACTISNNHITGADRVENLAGNGIHIWYGENLLIERNVLERCRDGIYFEFVSHSRIVENESHYNMRYGLHFMFSSDNLYRGNRFENNESGVAVMYSKRIRMTGNSFANSRGPAAYGILLKDISESDIRANRFVGNTVGVYVEGTTRSIFSGNLFKGNGWAMRILGDSDDNSVARNDFIGNTLDIATNATINGNRFSGNFWSRYRGIDLNHDGIGDDPYRPVQLTSLLMEKYGASVLLINSFFFALLDEVESVMPVLTPESFVDSTPLMHKVMEGP
jgi:nitrous oxidase accessory protein